MNKKLLLVLCFLTLQGYLFAQSFGIPSSSYSYYGDLTNNTASVGVPITNNSNSNLDVIIEKIQNNLAPFHSSLFCFGVSCYDSTTTFSQVINFTSHDTQILLSDLNKNGAIGTSCVSYKISDINNPSDFADVTICYNISATGINNISKNEALSVPQPNPADNFTSLNYSLNGDFKKYKINIYNILGNKVKESSFSDKSGIMLLQTSDLSSGIYFYSLIESGKIVSTNKLIVAHKN